MRKETKELLTFLKELAIANPNVSFFYNGHTGEIIADNTKTIGRNPIESVDELILPDDSRFIVNHVSSNLTDPENAVKSLQVLSMSPTRVIATIKTEDLYSREKEEKRKFFTPYSASDSLVKHEFNYLKESASKTKTKVAYALGLSKADKNVEVDSYTFGQLVEMNKESENSKSTKTDSVDYIEKTESTDETKGTKTETFTITNNNGESKKDESEKAATEWIKENFNSQEKPSAFETYETPALGSIVTAVPYKPVEPEKVEETAKEETEDLSYNYADNSKKDEPKESKGNLKNRVSYFFTRSENIKSTKTNNIIGPGPRKIVKMPLRYKAKGLYNRIKNSIKYTFTKSAVAVGATTILVKDKTSSLFRLTKNKIKYFFTRSILPGDEPKKDEPKKDQPAPIRRTRVVPTPVPTLVPTPTGTEPTPVTPQGDTPVQPKPTKSKEEEIIDKQKLLRDKEAYNKLGEFEKMFVDDAKAECLVPGDNEFRQMLNERCVNKDQIMNYYKALVVSESIKNQDDILYLFVSLDDYERAFVEDAFAENLTEEDNEYRQMINERCVNKEGISKFMKAYRDYINKQKVLINKYSDLTKDLTVLTINELRKLAKHHKDEMTDEELTSYKSSKLKKTELIDILEREDQKNIKKLSKGVC